MLDNSRPVVVHIPAVALRPEFSIDARRHAQVLVISYLIFSDNPGTESGAEVFALCRTQPAAHFPNPRPWCKPEFIEKTRETLLYPPHSIPFDLAQDRPLPPRERKPVPEI